MFIVEQVLICSHEVVYEVFVSKHIISVHITLINMFNGCRRVYGLFSLVADASSSGLSIKKQLRHFL